MKILPTILMICVAIIFCGCRATTVVKVKTYSPATLWVSPTGTNGIRGQQYSPYPTIDAAWQAMQPGDTVIIEGTNFVSTTIIFRSGIIMGEPSSLIILTNVATLEVVFPLTNNMTFDGLTIVEPVTTNSESVFGNGSSGATNVFFNNCSVVGGRPFYWHTNPNTVSWTIDHCIINGSSPICTEVNGANYTLITNCLLISTNGPPLVSRIYRGIYAARNPGRIDTFNTRIIYSDLGATNPAYAVATDIGIIPYSARSISSNSVRLFNVIFDGATCTNPMSADFLVTTNNAYLLNNVRRADGSNFTYYNPSNYSNPFNYVGSRNPSP
jgi:hypothetical protein